MKKIIGFSIDEDIINEIDDKRGFAPRSAIVNDILRKNLKGDKKTV